MLVHCRQGAKVENVSSTSGIYINSYFVLKKTQMIFACFDEHTVYNVLNYQALCLVLSYCHFSYNFSEEK
jgi:hypothetical protein